MRFFHKPFKRALDHFLNQNFTANRIAVTERYHFNRHSWDIEFEYFPLQRHYVMAIYALFTLASGLIKMSVLLFYQRLSSRAVSKAFLWTLRLTITAIGIYTGKNQSLR
jgi:hypothetical protein